MTNAQLGIESRYKTLFEEVMQRALNEVTMPNIFEDLSLIAWDSAASFAVSVIASNPKGENVTEYLSLAKAILIYLHPSRACWKKVSVFDVQKAPLRHYSLSCWAENCRDNGEKVELLVRRDRLPWNPLDRERYLEHHNFLRLWV